ncbi:MAG TPA: hypothetical protein VE222_04385, partial [Nitrospiraceae bacterium]|nr:hypothetical protein [Nitrospiraceae bacterium]
MSVSALLAGHPNGKYRYIFAVHNEYQKGVQPFSGLSQSHCGKAAINQGMIRLLDGIDDLEDSRIIGIAKPL